MNINNIIPNLIEKAPMTKAVAKSFVSKTSPEFFNPTWSAMPFDVKVIFAKSKNKNGKNFVSRIYKGLVKYMGVDGAPSNIKIKRMPPNVCGEYIPTKNRIIISEQRVKNKSREKAVATIAHELKHCAQTNTLIRAKGIDEYGKAIAEANVRVDVNHLLSNGEASPRIQRLITEEANSRYLANKSPIVKSFNKTINRKTHAIYKSEHKMSENYIDAYRTYSTSQRYYASNKLEVEARETGNLFSEYYKAFEAYCAFFSHHS
ncbi:MAG: hypothetical protein PHV37_01300 [Candidatus Gastranaerophilales bacterium]|nr:hypothetical protein [Candidatus Gastranaerophilales bacterium]